MSRDGEPGSYDVTWFPDRNLFAKVLGISWDRYSSRLTPEDQQTLLQGVAEWQAMSGYILPIELMHDPTGMITFLKEATATHMFEMTDQGVVFSEILSDLRTLSSEVAARIGIAEASLNKLFHTWSTAGKIPSEMNNFRRAIESVVVRIILEQQRHYHPILYGLQLDDKKSATTTLDDLKAHLSEQFKQRILQFYQGTGIYFLPPVIRDGLVPGFDDVNLSSIERLIRNLRNATNSSRMQTDVLVVSARGRVITGTILDLALDELVRSGQIELSTNPYAVETERTKVIQFMLTRARKAGLATASSIPVKKAESGMFEKIFLISTRNLAYYAKTQDITLGRLLDEFAEDLDPNFRNARRIYTGHDSYIELAATIAAHLHESGVSQTIVEELTTDTVMEMENEEGYILPPYFTTFTERKEIASKPTRSQFRSLARLYGVTAGELLQEIKRRYSSV